MVHTKATTRKVKGKGKRKEKRSTSKKGRKRMKDLIEQKKSEELISKRGAMIKHRNELKKGINPRMIDHYVTILDQRKRERMCYVCKSLKSEKEQPKFVNCEVEGCKKIYHKECSQKCLRHFCFDCWKIGKDVASVWQCMYCEIAFCKKHEKDFKSITICDGCQDLVNTI